VADASPSPRPQWGSLAFLAAALGLTGLSLTTISLVVWAAYGLAPLPTGIAQVPVLAAGTYTALGALLSARVPRNPVGWLFLGAGLILSLVMPTELLVKAASEAFRPAPPLTSYLCWLVSSFAMPALIGLLALAGLLFPDGRFLSRGWRWVALLAVVATLLLGSSVGLDHSGLLWYPTIGNPFRAPAAASPILDVIRVTSLLILAASVASVVIVQALRYRGGDAVTRAQLRWVLSAATLSAMTMIPVICVRYVIDADQAVMDGLAVANQAALMLLPLAAVLGITRYHLYGIDVLIGRTLVYVPLMGALGGLYALAVVVFQRVFMALTGETSDVALLLAVFLIAATFTPMRKALEGAVDRWARPSVERGPQASATEHAPATGELQATAAHLIALRRFEDRLVSGDMRPGPHAGRGLDIDASGRVRCPRGTDVPFMNCLACEHLVAITTSPSAVVCDPTRIAEAGA
jgi:hypothetical protein